jgi:4-amino-4-deoxy-L-arabinose transferase-like glycosyltransferase
MKINIQAAASFVLLLLLCIASFFLRLSAIPVRIWDESRNAMNAWEMYLNGNPFIPYYEGAPDMWNTKPPLLIWLQTGCMKLFGVHEFALRFPSALAATGTVLLLWWFLNKLFHRPWLAFLGGAVLATTLAYVLNHAGRTGDYDALMVFCMTAGSFSFFLFLHNNDKKWLHACFLFLTLAVFTKGIAGLTLLPGLFLFAWSRKKIVVLLHERAFYLGLLAFILLTGSYYGIRELYNPHYLRAVYENELGGRYLSALEGHDRPFLFYYDNLRQWRNPYWFYFLLPAFIIPAFRNLLAAKLTLFNFLMTVPFFLIISFAGTKLDWYDLPVYPFLAVQTGLLLFTIFEWGTGFIKNKIWKYLLPALLCLLIFYIPVRQVYDAVFYFQEKPWDLVPHQQGKFLQQNIREHKDLNHYAFCYDGYNAQLLFYIRPLQHQKINTVAITDITMLQPGQYAVVNQDALKAQLFRHYRVKKLDERFGCTVYLVQSRL